MQPIDLTVYIVDDDRSVRESLAAMLNAAGYRTAVFPDAESFLAAYDHGWTGCLLVDLRLPGKSGTELQSELRSRGASLPVVIVTAHGDVQSARSAFHADAVDFLEKPFDHDQLMAAIERAFQREKERLKSEQANLEEADKLARLTNRERAVLEHVTRGLHARDIGERLGISARTVEVHRARLMSKLGVKNIVELVRFALVRPGDQANERAAGQANGEVQGQTGQQKNTSTNGSKK